MLIDLMLGDLGLFGRVNLDKTCKRFIYKKSPIVVKRRKANKLASKARHRK